MALSSCEMGFNGIKIAVFSKKLTKNCPTAGGFAPRPTSVIRLRYTSFLNTSSPKLDICTFQLLHKALSLCKILVKCQPAAISNLPFYDILVPQTVSLLKIFDDVIACDLCFGPPNQSKILATPINWRLPAKLFWRRLLLENTCSCVLGPWPWPRTFLSLALRVSVLEKAVLGLGLGIFLCPCLGLEPCVLDSTSGVYVFSECIWDIIFTSLHNLYNCYVKIAYLLRCGK